MDMNMLAHTDIVINFVAFQVVGIVTVDMN